MSTSQLLIGYAMVVAVSVFASFIYRKYSTNRHALLAGMVLLLYCVGNSLSVADYTAEVEHDLWWPGFLLGMMTTCSVASATVAIAGTVIFRWKSAAK